MRLLSTFCAALFALFSAHAQEMQVLCESPRIYLITGFLTHDECDYIIQQATPHLTRSTVLDAKVGQIDPRRTSAGMFFSKNSQNRTLHAIEKKIAKLTKIPIENGEGIQVLRYGSGGEYQPHFDYFTASQSGGQETLNRGGQRVATLIMYLNTPEAGGATIFPRLGITVTPQKGNALLFYNVTPSGDIDPNSMHGGAPVITGEKWIATKWLRERTFH